MRFRLLYYGVAEPKEKLCTRNIYIFTIDVLLIVHEIEILQIVNVDGSIVHGRFHSWCAIMC
jgi:hypothetical protein